MMPVVSSLKRTENSLTASAKFMSGIKTVVDGIEK